MQRIHVKFDSVEQASRFVRIVSKYDGDFDLYRGSHCVDAKSILGVMTLGLRSNMMMLSNCDSRENDKLISELGDVVVA